MIVKVCLFFFLSKKKFDLVCKYIYRKELLIVSMVNEYFSAEAGNILLNGQ